MDEKKDKLDELICAAAHCGGDLDVEMQKIFAEAPEGIFPPLERDVTGTLICPGLPKICLGSGNFPGFECCCDECDHLARCLADGEHEKQAKAAREEVFLEYLCHVIHNEVQKPNREQNLEWIRFCSDLLDFLTPELFAAEELAERLQKIKAGCQTADSETLPGEKDEPIA